MIVCLFGMHFSILQSQTIFQNALHINKLRAHYESYCNSICQQNQLFSESDRNNLIKGKNLSIPKSDGPLRLEIKSILQSEIIDDRNSNDTKANQDQNLGPSEAQIQRVASEWALVEAYINTTQSNLKLDNINTESFQGFGNNFNYLHKISDRVGGSTQTDPLGTSGAFSSILGLNEAEIIMGVVDWSLNQAKQELMKAFLSEWLNKLENDSAMQLLFPSTLNLLRTTDITTVFSNGQVWKAAFKKDLDAISQKFPQFVQLLLKHIPQKVLNANDRLTIEGSVRVASTIYQRIGKGNTIDDVILTLSQRSMLLPDNQLSIIEKAVIFCQALIQSTQILHQNQVSFAKPSTIASLNERQMMDLWNLMFLSLRPKFEKVFTGIESDTIYSRISNALPLFQYKLVEMADILQSIKQITDNGEGNSNPKKTLDFQETDRYFRLSLDLIENGLSLFDSLHFMPQNDIEFFNSKVHPILVDIMNGIQGIETQQYGLLVSSLIDLTEKLNLQNARNLDALAAAANLIIQLKKQSEELLTSSNSSKLVPKIGDQIMSYAKEYPDVLNSNAVMSSFHRDLVSVSIALFQFRLPPTATGATHKKFVDSQVQRLEKSYNKLKKNFVLVDQNAQLGQNINTYGRLLVNLLTAKTSEDVETILNEVTLGTGGYMVKQTSRSSFTLSVFPGLGGGVDLGSKPLNLKSNYNVFGGASLPVGLEYARGIRHCKVLGAIGIYGQIADLGTLLSFRLSNPDTVAPQISFQKVMSPGISVLLHGTKVPIVLGLGIAYTPGFSLNQQGISVSSSLRAGLTLAVDVTALQLFASKKKINANYLSLGQQAIYKN